ncbi:MAG: AI-2E family transporter [Ruminococcaceae bacterium]|nr:AI-2E family transporter [Oscillospiraceae bacterium]
MNRKRYFCWGLTAFLTVCALMVFYDTVFRNGVLFTLLGTLLKALSPVIYGAVLAYLLAPVVNSFDELFGRRLGKSWSPVLVRACSILLTWSIMLFFVYLLFSILIPQLYQSIVTLVNNLQTYYNTVYGWVMQLLDRNPRVAEFARQAIDDYWDELRKWFTNTFLPQAQQTIGVLAGGVVSVLVFCKDLLVGIVVSVYLLVLKERFAAGAKRILYSLMSDRLYCDSLKSLRRANRIFSGFFRGKLLDSLIVGVLCFIGATILRLPYTPLVSVFVGVTNIIPFFGPFIGAIPSAFLILLVSPAKCLYFIIFVLVLQQLDGNVIGPKILGGSTELPSFWVIVAILLGGGFFGVPGMFLGVPVFACVYAIVGYHIERRLEKRGAPPADAFAAGGVLADPPPADHTNKQKQGETES